MVKITKSARQYKISIPQEIINITGWDENTELLFIPFIQEPRSEVGKVPILLAEIKKASKAVKSVKK